MMALSLHQPWGSLFLSGRKSIDIRSWSTKYRGDVLIASSKQRSCEVLHNCHHFGLNPFELPYGVGLCVCTLLDVIPFTKAHEEQALVEHEEDLFAWLFDNRRPIKPMNVRGRQRLFSVPDEFIRFAERER